MQAELLRILRPGGRLAFVCFEVDPDRARDIAVLGAGPVGDYRPLLEDAGFVVQRYEETTGWEERVDGAFRAVMEAGDALVADMGPEAGGAAVAEATITVQVRPYRRRILAGARKTVDGEGSPTGRAGRG